MKLTEAIETVYELIRINKHVAIPGHLGAMKLLIEAGKRIDSNRHINNHPDQALLPGETTE